MYFKISLNLNKKLSPYLSLILLKMGGYLRDTVYYLKKRRLHEGYGSLPGETEATRGIRVAA
jgi:hypothetical protein